MVLDVSVFLVIGSLTRYEYFDHVRVLIFIHTARAPWSASARPLNDADIWQSDHCFIRLSIPLTGGVLVLKLELALFYIDIEKGSLLVLKSHLHT